MLKQSLSISELIMGTVMLKEETKKKSKKVAVGWDKFYVFCQTVKGVTTEEFLRELKIGRIEDEKICFKLI